MKMNIPHSARGACVAHHLCPSITHSSPSRTIDERMFVASEEATSGSVIANDDRISPASSGSSQVAR